MLILFKPWSDPGDLIHDINAPNIEGTCEEAFENMICQSPQTRRYLANMQALHECKDSCDNHFQACQLNRKSRPNGHQDDRGDACDDFMFGNPDEIGDKILEHLNDTESC